MEDLEELSAKIVAAFMEKDFPNFCFFSPSEFKCPIVFAENCLKSYEYYYCRLSWTSAREFLSSRDIHVPVCFFVEYYDGDVDSSGRILFTKVFQTMCSLTTDDLEEFL
jgi:hypothetical protein